MKIKLPQFRQEWLWGVALFLTLAVGILSAESWIPAVRGRLEATVALFKPPVEETDEEDGHDHGGGENSIKLSDQALKNIGVPPEALKPLQRQDYTRYLTVPAIVVERPGATRVQISSQLTGVVEGVYVVPGQAVKSGDLLFRIRLTHEDLVKTQTAFLEAVGELRVVEIDIKRLEKLTQGLAPAKLRDRRYERQKLNQRLDAKAAGLRLHGLSLVQIQEMRTATKPRLIREVDVRVPFLHADGSLHDDSEDEQEKLTSSRFVVRDLSMSRGRSVKSGDALAVLADFRKLDIRGTAYEYDQRDLQSAMKSQLAIRAIFQGDVTVPSNTLLRIRYIENEIENTSRALHFFVDLPNPDPVVSSSQDSNAEFLTWRFRPGQRLQLRIPVQVFADRFVLPVDAVVRDGAESYVFIQNGKNFKRKAVHVEFQDRESVVIADDGAIYPGDVVAQAGAYQMLMALKNKAGAGADPHAGHNH